MKQEIENYIFTRSAAERILELPAFSIQQIKVYSNAILAKNKQQHLYTMEREWFLHDFAQSRINKAFKLKVEKTNYSNLYRVTNPENKHQYPVRLISEKVECKCRDYQKQQEILGKGCCKHGYAVLNSLGYKHLEDYLSQQVSA